MRPLFEKPSGSLLDHFKQNPWLVAAAIIGNLFVGYLIFKNSPPAHINEPDFIEYMIRSKISEIEYYDKGLPRVKLADGRSIYLEIRGVGGAKYVQPNDSLVKDVGTDTVTVYRRYEKYEEVSIFGDDGHDGLTNLDYPYSGLLKRYRIPK